MENHGINMVGNYFMETVSGPVSGAAADERRLVYNESATINGNPDVKGQYKLFYSGRDSLGQNKWLRPLVANDNDQPDADDTHELGSSSYKWKAIYSTDYYGQVRYS